LININKVMNIANIRAFLEVASAGSFQQAAQNLNITQSAISARIKNLEQILNRQLFNRKRNGATLTAGGSAFHKHAVSMASTWELAKQEAALSKEFNAIVGLGVQLNHWKSIASPWLNWMNENAADMATQVRSDYSDQLMRMLRNGLLNVAIVNEPQRNPDIVITEYDTHQLVMVSTTTRAVEKTAVDGYIYVDWGDSFRAAHSAAYPDSPTHQMTVGLASVGLNHIIEQGGSGYFLERDIRTYVADNKLFYVDDAPDFSLTTYLAYFAETSKTPAVQTALKGLQQIKST
jgi:DNA-binding transcriptional LysR family regulator